MLETVLMCFLPLEFYLRLLLSGCSPYKSRQQRVNYALNHIAVFKDRPEEHSKLFLLKKAFRGFLHGGSIIAHFGPLVTSPTVMTSCEAVWVPASWAPKLSGGR